MSCAGLLLAAGAGSRMGRPKALVHDPDGTSWLARSVVVLHDAGCSPVVVVLGARADEAMALVPDGAHVVVADAWADGMSASLRAGLLALLDGSFDGPFDGSFDAAVISLVDLPDVTADVVARVAAAGAGRNALVRATYDGRPGHPVLAGRDHWAPMAAEVAGDRGAAGYLTTHGVVAVECADLATGRDQDTRRP